MQFVTMHESNSQREIAAIAPGRRAAYPLLMMHGHTVRWTRMAGRVAARIAVLVLLLASVVIGGSILPANRDAVPAAQGVTIYIYSNGVHTGLVLPAVTPLHDWRKRVRADDLADPRRAGSWLLFGWGQRDFYLNTPQWRDVDLRIAGEALIGSDRTLIHIDHLRRLWRSPDLRPLVLSAAQYQALVRAIESDFAPGGAIRGYGPDDIFYPARGRYSAVRTCNEWTGAKLRDIGVRVGLWTPLSWSLMRWF